jgi:MFS transporter, putative metabolite:H+ symporter
MHSPHVTSLGAYIDALPLNRRHIIIVLVVCSLGFLFDGIDFQIMSFVAPNLAKEWQLQPQALGTVLSTTIFGMIVGAYVFGILSDYIGRRTGFQLTVAFYAVFTGVCAFVNNILQLASARFGVGIGVGGFPAVDSTVLSEFMPAQHRGKMTSWSIVLFPLGGLIAAWLASVIIPTYGWRALLLVGVAPAFLVLFVRLAIPESPRFLLQKGRVEEAERSIKWISLGHLPLITQRTDTAVILVPPQKVPFAELFSQTFLRRTFLVAFMWATWNFAYFGLILWLPTILTQYKGIPADRVYPFMMGFLASGILGRVVSSYLLDVVGRRAVMGTCGVLGGLFMFMLGTQDGFYHLLIVGLLLGPFHDAMGGCIAAYNAELYPTRMRTTGLGWGSGVGRIGSSLAPMAVGFLISRSVLAVFVMLAVCYLAYGMSIILFREETKNMPLEQAALEK